MSSSARSVDAAAHAERQIAADSGRASSVLQLAASDGNAADAVSLAQPGKVEYGTGWNTTPAGWDVAAGGTTRAAAGIGAGTVTHEPSAQSAAALESIAMTWLILEALVALLLAVFIVWFTMGARRKPPPRVPPGAPPPRDGESGKGDPKE